jgi:hypothetical protein
VSLCKLVPEFLSPHLESTSFSNGARHGRGENLQDGEFFMGGKLRFVTYNSHGNLPYLKICDVDKSVPLR